MVKRGNGAVRRKCRCSVGIVVYGQSSGKRKDSFIKGDMPGDVNMARDDIKAAIAFMLVGIA